MSIKIIRKNVKNLTLRVRATGEVELVAPTRLSKAYIDKFVESKRGWIEKKLAEAKTKKRVIRSKLNTGDKVPYLGKEYPLQVIESRKNFADYEDGVLKLYVTDTKSFELKNEVLNGWYRDQGRVVFLPIIAKYLKMTGKMVERVTVKTMKTKWGSCNTMKKYLNLNSEMLKRDIRFVEYVILHEIAHLEHPNHSKHFYNYVARFMPDWEERKKL